MYDLLAAPFLGRYLLLHPGSTDGVQLPRGHFDQLVQAAAARGSYPPWLPGLARQRWGWNFRNPTRWTGGCSSARSRRTGTDGPSWEISLGCNYDCALLPGPEAVLRDAGVVWLHG